MPKKKNLTKKDLAKEISYLLDLPMYKHREFHGPAYNVVKTVLRVVVDALARGESVFIPGFGTFEWYERPARLNTVCYSYDGKPATKDLPRVTNSLPPKRRVIFKPSKVLGKLINDNMS